jgi:hypothetical protein
MSEQEVASKQQIDHIPRAQQDHQPEYLQHLQHLQYLWHQLKLQRRIMM